MEDKVIILDRTLPPQTWYGKAYAFLGGTEARASLSIFIGVCLSGLVLGFVVPPDNSADPAGWRTVSNIVGWIYFMAWSVSFYPQVILNWQRRSVVGLSFDYVVLNLLGFACYTAYNCAYMWNDSIRAEYVAQNNGSLPAVRTNDAFFAIHAVTLTAIVCIQIIIYDKGGQRVSNTAWAIFAALLVAIIIYLGCTAAGATAQTTWLNFLLFLSYVKLAITLMKYSPQVVLNCRRKNTAGWTIHNVILDFTGGMLSLVQLIMDCAVQNDWSGISGDPVKFGLGLVSMVYDLIFMVQHYCLYSGAAHEAEYSALDASASSEFVDERYIRTVSQLSSPDGMSRLPPPHVAGSFQIDGAASPITVSTRSGVQPYTGDSLAAGRV